MSPAAAHLLAQRAIQGLPSRVADPVTLHKVATVLAGTRGGDSRAGSAA